jgi:hypothetical protein
VICCSLYNGEVMSDLLTWSALQVGLHQAALRCLPLFLLYLVTLMHTYSLAYLQVRHICQSASNHGRLAPDVAVFQLHLHLQSLPVS